MHSQLMFNECIVQTRANRTVAVEVSLTAPRSMAPGIRCDASNTIDVYQSVLGHKAAERDYATTIDQLPDLVHSMEIVLLS